MKNIIGPRPSFTLPKFRRCIYCGKMFLEADRGIMKRQEEDICSICKAKEGWEKIKDFIDKL
jgi:hypothetical protein